MRAILTYHSIDPSGSPVSIDELVLRRHIAWLRSGRVQVVPLERITDVSPERDAVAITFDDGFSNFETVAWPLLRHQDFPVTLFVASERVGKDNAWGGAAAPGIPTLALVGWDGLAKMVREPDGGTQLTTTQRHRSEPIEEAGILNQSAGLDAQAGLGRCGMASEGIAAHEGQRAAAVDHDRAG